MKKENIASRAVSKTARPFEWQIVVRRIAASTNEMPHGCSNCISPVRQPQAAIGKQN